MRAITQVAMNTRRTSHDSRISACDGGLGSDCESTIRDPSAGREPILRVIKSPTNSSAFQPTRMPCSERKTDLTEKRFRRIVALRSLLNYASTWIRDVGPVQIALHATGFEVRCIAGCRRQLCDMHLVSLMTDSGRQSAARLTVTDSYRPAAVLGGRRLSGNQKRYRSNDLQASRH